MKTELKYVINHVLTEAYPKPRKETSIVLNGIIYA